MEGARPERRSEGEEERKKGKKGGKKEEEVWMTRFAVRCAVAPLILINNEIGNWRRRRAASGRGRREGGKEGSTGQRV